MAVNEIQCKTALNKVKGAYPYTWDLNIYRGCTHGCKYCYALYSHRYLDRKNFYTHVFAKTNVAQVLDGELAKHDLSELVNIGSVCDSYQPLEKEMELMPQVLELFIKYRIPAIISTKSDLILRDLELIDKLSKVTYVNVAASLVTMDEDIQKLIEPGAVSPDRRIAMLKEIKEHTDAFTGVHCMPILPYITDDEDSIRAVFAAAKDAGVSYVLPGGLGLRGQTQKAYFSFLEENMPDVLDKYTALRKDKEGFKQYKIDLKAKTDALLKEYGLTSDYTKNINSRVNKQMTLFD